MANSQADIAMSATPALTLDIPVLPETALGYALHLVELLRAAQLVARLRQGAAAPRIGWRCLDAQGRPLRTDAGLLGPCLREGAFDGPATAVFIAPLHCPDIPSVRQAAQAHVGLSRRIGVAVDQGQQIVTLGNAAWLAARSQRLSGRRVALPWYCIAGFGHDFPDIPVAEGESVCQDGPWLSAGLAQDIGPLAIALLRHGLGAEPADALALALLPDPVRERTALGALRAQQIPTTRDSCLARAIAHLEQHLEQPYVLEHVAEAAAVSPRTLLRHFQQALGHSPLDHLHQLRCARARVMLEITLESVPSVAQACGYADPAAFRRIFARHTGLTPTAYRQRHSLRAPRQRWRVGWPREA